MTQQNHIIQPPKIPYRVYNVSENETNSNIKNNHTSKFKPISTSPPDRVQHPITPTSQSESYLFGNPHTSKPDQQ
jgi:hypothetical protein